MSGERLDPRRLRRFVRFCLAVLIILAVVGTVYSALLVPILVSAFLTYLMLPVVERLQRARLPRTLAAFAIVACGIAVLVLAAVEGAPVLYRQALLLVQLIPGAATIAFSTWLPIAEKYISGLGVIPAGDVHTFFGMNSLVGRVANQLQGGVTGLWRTGTSVAGGVVYLVLIPLLTFFLLKDYPAGKRWLTSLVPRDLVEPVQRVSHKIDLTLRSVLKGQAIVAGILTVLYVVGLTAVGLQSAIVIGVIAGICRIIPYFDVIVGGTLSTVVLLSNFGGWGQVLSVVLVFLIVQAVDGAFITPAVIGERIGLHPVLVILSVLAFGDWLGFWGVLLAIPMAAVLKVTIEAAVPYYRASRAYGTVVQAPPPEIEAPRQQP